MTAGKSVRKLATILAVMGAAPADAQHMEVVPSCYAAVNIGIAAPAPSRAMFVLLDQTTPMAAGLFDTLRRETLANATPGTRFAVATFSATAGGDYTRIGTTGTLESPVPVRQRNSLSVPRLAQLDQCLAQQRGFAARRLDAAIGDAARSSRASYDHSEIMRSLVQLSARVAATPAAQRIVVIYSDMIEHSDATSFYQSRALRLIDPRQEMARAGQQGLFGNFAGARVYVIGAGLAPSGPMRDSRARDALRSFWAAWFARSHALLVEVGAPDLMNPVR